MVSPPIEMRGLAESVRQDIEAAKLSVKELEQAVIWLHCGSLSRGVWQLCLPCVKRRENNKDVSSLPVFAKEASQ